MELKDTKEIEGATAQAQELAAASMTSYEEKYYAGLDELTAYIATNTTSIPIAAATAAHAPVTGTSGTASPPPKLSEGKLLFPDFISKSKSPEEFRMWVGVFRHLYDASGLAQHHVATQQGYLLRGIDFELRKPIGAKITPTMQIFGPGGCVELLEQEFKNIYPIFSRRLDFFQHNQKLGEESSAFLHRISTMGDKADLENLTMEDLKAFGFIAGCNVKKLREKVFQLKRRDLTAIKEVVAQHETELKAENALT